MAKRSELQQVEKFCFKGGVPDYRRVYADHPKEDNLHNAIRHLFDEYQDSTFAFLVVHGVVGVGKTFLAAKAIRNSDLLLKHYADGVSWHSLGHLRKKNSEELEERLVEILMSISINLWIDVRIRGPPTLQSLLDVLRAPLIDRKVLLVFDDVWDKRIVDFVLKHIPAKMLITTRNAALFSQCSCVERFQLEPIEGFGKQFFEEQLATVSEMRKLRGNEDQLKPFFRHCQGLPLFLQIVCSLYDQYNCRYGDSAQQELERDLTTGRVFRQQLTFPNDHESIQETFAISLIDLHAEQQHLSHARWTKNPMLFDRLLDLAGMNPDLNELITGEDAKEWWKLAANCDGEEILAALAERGLMVEHKVSNGFRKFGIPKPQLLFLREFIKGTEGLLGGLVDRWEKRRPKLVTSKEYSTKNYADFYVYYPSEASDDDLDYWSVDNWIIEKLLPAVEDDRLKGFFYVRDSGYGNLVDPVDAICSVDKVLVVLTKSLAAWSGLSAHLSLMIKTNTENDQVKVIVVQIDPNIETSQLDQFGSAVRKFDLSRFQGKSIDDKTMVAEIRQVLRYRSCFMESLQARMLRSLSYDDY